MAGGRGGRGNGRGGRGGGGGNNGRRVVQVVSPQPGAKNKTGGAKTLDARFTALNKRRAEQVQRGPSLVPVSYTHLTLPTTPYV